MDNITFKPLSVTHFTLLLKWLMTSHVKKWWDQDVEWTEELIKNKYQDYINGSKPIYGYIFYSNRIPIGYIQYYNLYDFPREQNYKITNLPKNCAAIDFYIGEAEFLGKGIGAKILKLFIEQYVLRYFDHVFVDPDIANIAAIKTYKKVGFKELGRTDKSLLMVK